MKKIAFILLVLIFLVGCQRTPDIFHGDIEEVLKLGGSYNCTAVKEGEYDLNILIKNTKLKGSAKTKQGIIESVGDITDCVYGWYSESKKGQVVCITKEELKQGISLLGKSKDTNITLDCTKYKIEEQIFQKPKDVEFSATTGP